MSNQEPTYHELQARLAEAETTIEHLRQVLADTIARDAHCALEHMPDAKEAPFVERGPRCAVADNVPDPVAGTYVDGHFRATTAASLRPVRSCAAEEMANKADVGFTPPLPAGRHHADEQLSVRSHHPFGDRSEQRAPLLDRPGRVVVSAGTVHDITARMWAEDQRERLQAQILQSQKMEALGRLTAGIAHDFNNFLTAINGFAELLQFQMALDDPLRKHVAKILQSGKGAGDLVRQLMSFSREQMTTIEVVDINTVLADMRSMLQRIIGENIVLEADLAGDLSPVKADPAQLQQVIVNLAVNARDAMPAGGRLTLSTANMVLDESDVTTHPGMQPGQYVMLAISDTGCGMSPEVMAHIFEPFFTTKDHGKGTGLGLATVYDIVTKSGGIICVCSEVGAGTTFRIHLPPTQEAIAPPAPGSPADVVSSVATILLVEDQADVRESVAEMLELRGYQVIGAASAEEALRLSQECDDPIHALLTDVVLPGVSGKDLAARLTRQRPDLKVLYMSGYSDDVIAHHVNLETGAAFLHKPFTVMDIVSKLKLLLDRSSPSGSGGQEYLADGGQRGPADHREVVAGKASALVRQELGATPD